MRLRACDDGQRSAFVIVPTWVLVGTYGDSQESLEAVVVQVKRRK